MWDGGSIFSQSSILILQSLIERRENKSPFSYSDGLPLLCAAALRAGITVDCKKAGSHVEEREERKEKKSGAPLPAGSIRRSLLCSWACRH